MGTLVKRLNSVLKEKLGVEPDWGQVLIIAALLLLAMLVSTVARRA